MGEDVGKWMYDICEETLHRTERVGACPVLRVQVTYPRLVCAEDDEGVCRFNDTYRQAAEKFITWAIDTLAPKVREDFEKAGAGAAYRFARREASCFIIAQWADGARMEVTTGVSWGAKGAEEWRKMIVCKEIWRFPQGWVEAGERKGVGQIAKIKKNARNLLKKCRECGTIVESVP